MEHAGVQTGITIHFNRFVNHGLNISTNEKIPWMGDGTDNHKTRDLPGEASWFQS